MLDIFDAVKDIDGTRKYIFKKLNENDRQLSNLYHSLDTEKDLDMYRGYLIYKELKEIISRRIHIKHAMSVFKMPKRKRKRR